MKVLGVGEVIVKFSPTNRGRLRYKSIFERHVGGSEANVIVGMSRLGYEPVFFTAVGGDELGKSVALALKAEGVGTKFVKISGNGFTPVLFEQRGYPIPNKTDVLYFRKGSAFSKITPKDINLEMFNGVNLLFISGITPALSGSCYLSAQKAVKIAKEKNVKVAFDTNIRKKLLPDKKIAIRTLSFFIQKADILITGTGDLEFMFPNLSLDVQIKSLRNLAKTDLIILKMGREGSRAYKEKDVFEAKAFDTEVIDEVGAGDAFNAAFLASFLRGDSINEALVYGNAAGAIAVGSIGDIEPLPDWGELETFISFQKSGEKKLMR